MKYTNNKNYPKFVQEWLEFDEYDRTEGEISATTLLKPSQVFVLTRKFQEKLTIDVNDLIAAKLGTAIHDSVEKVKLTNCLQEQRLRTEIDGQVISGKFDIIINADQPIKKIVDIKSTSVWAYIFGGKDEEYIKQLSIYKYLASKNGIELEEEALIQFVFTDWSKSKARLGGNYPENRIAIKPIKLMSLEDTEVFIKQRLSLFKEEMSKEIGEQIPCNQNELWIKESTFAVMKEGRKSAVKLFKNEGEAEFFVAGQGGMSKLSINERKEKAKRCEYCAVRKFCQQAKKMEETGLLDTE